MPKHYIRIDKEKNIIYIFCTDFEQPKKNDICVNKNGERHFHLKKGLINKNGKYNYKYANKKIKERTEKEKWTKKELDEKKKEKLINEEIKLLQREQAIQSLKDKNKWKFDN